MININTSAVIVYYLFTGILSSVYWDVHCVGEKITIYIPIPAQSSLFASLAELEAVEAFC